MLEEKIAESTEEKVETPAEETAAPEETTTPEKTAPAAEIVEKPSGEEEEANIPSWRLREERERRTAAETELAALKGRQGAPAAPAASATTIREQLKKRLKHTVNAETGELEVSDEALNTYGWLVQQGVERATRPIINQLANSSISAQKAALRERPHFKKLESRIDEQLKNMTPEQKMTEGAVEVVYKYLRGDLFEELAKETQPKGDKKPQIVGDITPHKTKTAPASTGTPALNEAQQKEFENNWKPKGFNEADYAELLNRARQQDAERGLKTKRETLTQSIRS